VRPPRQTQMLNKLPPLILTFSPLRTGRRDMLRSLLATKPINGGDSGVPDWGVGSRQRRALKMGATRVEDANATSGRAHSGYGGANLAA
jgi:hypothetical protein